MKLLITILYRSPSLLWYLLWKLKIVKDNCWFNGHDWYWIHDDDDEEQQIYKAGGCRRCGEKGDGIFPPE